MHLHFVHYGPFWELQIPPLKLTCTDNLRTGKNFGAVLDKKCIISQALSADKKQKGLILSTRGSEGPKVPYLEDIS